MMIGQTIGHYRIVEEIGHGGMGVVYKALDTKLSRPVAIKALRADEAHDETARKRFLREATTVAQLDHPRVVVARAAQRDTQLSVSIGAGK